MIIKTTDQLMVTKPNTNQVKTQMTTKLIMESTYASLLEDYSEIMYEELMSNSDIAFEELDREDQNDKYDLLGNFQWKDFTEENTKLYITPHDIETLKIIITVSPYFEFAFDNKHSKSKYKNLTIDIFKRHCYLIAIVKYTKAFNEEFKTPKFLTDTEEYVNDKPRILNDFFTGL